MTTEHVQALMDDYNALLDYLRQQQEISFLVAAESSFPKVALLAVASDLEHRVENVLITYFQRVTSSNYYAVSFVRNKAIKRQFHSYFSWPERSANTFFGLFGDEFKKKVKDMLRSDDELAQSVTDFCEIGHLRNQLVHRNYASFVMEKTAADVYELYQSALTFTDRLPHLLDNLETVQEPVHG